MSQSEAPSGPREPHWDASVVRNHACDVVSAIGTTSEVVVNFGATHAGDGPSEEITVRPRRSFALQPRAAQNLRDVLRNLLAEADAERRP